MRQFLLLPNFVGNVLETIHQKIQTSLNHCFLDIIFIPFYQNIHILFGYLIIFQLWRKFLQMHFLSLCLLQKSKKLYAFLELEILEDHWDLKCIYKLYWYYTIKIYVHIHEVLDHPINPISVILEL